jgi:hypothetical protein
VGAACAPTTSRGADTVDRAAAARAATRALEAAQERDPGCANVVMSEETRATTGPEHLVQLTDAYAVAEPCWDKVVFTFESTGADMPPGYQVEYRKGPFTEGDAGQYTVETLGEAFLYVTLAPATSTEGGDPEAPDTYPGNLRLRLDGMHHTEIVRKIIDGPGTQMWLIGLDVKRPFTVDAANSPPRVAIYIAR